MYAHLIYQSIAKLFSEPGVDPGGGGGGGGGGGRRSVISNTN